MTAVQRQRRAVDRVLVDQPTGVRSSNRRAVPSLLRDAGLATLPLLQAAVGTLPPTLREPAEHHFGWGDGGTGGKALRPALALLAAEAVGGDPAPALPAAAAVELVHNWSLVHDDVMDGDTERRHRPTVWVRFGVGRAVLVGDALLALATELLEPAALPAAQQAAAPVALRLLLASVRELVEGQAADLVAENAQVSPIQAIRTAEGKTGALLGAAAATGAALAGASAPAIAAWDRFGRDLGIAFQLVDDQLGIWGRAEVTGKPAAADLRARRCTTPVAAAIAAGGPAASRLAEFLAGTGEPSPEEVAEAAHLVVTAGGREFARQEVANRRQAGLAHLDALALPLDVHRQVQDLADFVTDREF